MPRTNFDSSEGEALIGRAQALATHWHADAIRKVGGEPYIIHPAAVAQMLKDQNFPPEYIAAAWCHDLLEDTGCKPADIERECGPEVLAIVQAVSHDKTIKDWRARKQHYIDQVRQASEGAKAVCCADKIHNAQSLISSYQKLGPEIWQKFNTDRSNKLWFDREVLHMLQETWQHPMVEVFAELVDEIENLK